MNKIFLVVLSFMLVSQAVFLLSQEQKAFVELQNLHLKQVQNHNKQQKYERKVSSNWMKYLDNNLKVSEISIPATHDTGTFRCIAQMDCITYQCQSWPIYSQLKYGIRYFDLRVNSQLPLTIGHQKVKFMRFNQILIDTKRFLKQNPTQFLIFAFQKNQGDTDPSLDIQKQFQKYNLSIVYRTHQNMPIVAELRGKIWVYSGLGIHFNQNTFVMNGVIGITDTQAIYLQNYWEVYPQNITQKTTYANHTAFAVGCSKQRMKINFLSGSVGIAPIQLVKHKEGPNSIILQNLQRIPYICLGVTLMDFPDVKLIKSIVRSNFILPPQQL